MNFQIVLFEVFFLLLFDYFEIHLHLLPSLSNRWLLLLRGPFCSITFLVNFYRLILFYYVLVAFFFCVWALWADHPLFGLSLIQSTVFKEDPVFRIVILRFRQNVLLNSRRPGQFRRPGRRRQPWRQIQILTLIVRMSPKLCLWRPMLILIRWRQLSWPSVWH